VFLNVLKCVLQSLRIRPLVYSSGRRRLINGCSSRCVESAFALTASATLGAPGYGHSGRAHHGIPLRELDLTWWRNQIALVSQDIYLFNASVAENIRYGKLDATREELLEAAGKAHALEFIKDLPDGFETLLGERVLRLPGGQRQRLALARAFIRDPQILILDEATNSLDLISEGVVRDALMQFGRNRTVLIVAHRISTIEHADKILVPRLGEGSRERDSNAALGSGWPFLTILCASIS
jgi:ABC-type multidrug transport system fused ATPase/permease subunit